MYKRILITYFSGTGGTKRIAEAFYRDLQDRGCTVELVSLDAPNQHKDKNVKKLLSDAELTFLIFAVHAFDAPEPVYRWIETIEPADKDFAVISVSGGGEIWPNTGCRNSCCEALEDKGFRVVYEKMMVMPCNWITPMDDHLVMWLLKVIPEKVSRVVDSIFSGKVRRTAFKMDFIRRKLIAIEKANTHTFTKSLKASEKCTGCGWCANTCPVGNIVLKDRRPKFLDQCVMCFRCVYGCPYKAIETKHFMVIKSGFDISAVEKKMAGVELKPIKIAARNIAWLGVKWYLTDRDGY